MGWTRTLWVSLAMMMGSVGAAQAHTLGGSGAGFVAGFAHPLGGLDHVLAMVAVGLWAAQLGGRATWQVPLAFVATMAVGGMLGFSGVALPSVELGIAGSLLVLGAMVAAAVRLPVALGAGLVGFFALFHGHAHGAEMPAIASAGLYAFGFMLATALLHAAGLVAGLGLKHRAAEWVVRLGGAGVAAAGVVLLAV